MPILKAMPILAPIAHYLEYPSKRENEKKIFNEAKIVTSWSIEWERFAAKIISFERARQGSDASFSKDSKTEKLFQRAYKPMNERAIRYMTAEYARGLKNEVERTEKKKYEQQDLSKNYNIQ